MKIEDWNMQKDQLHLDITLKDEGGTYDLTTSGKIYPSDNTYTGGYLVNLNDTEEYTILSFKIEENAKEALLLPINEDLVNDTVIKVAIVDNRSDDLLYFEDRLSSTATLQAIKKASQELTSDTLDNTNDFEKKQAKLENMETWFMPYLHTNKEKRYNKTRSD